MRTRLPICTVLIALVLAAPAVSTAQSPRIAVAVQAAPIYLYPDATRQPLRVAKEGTRLRVLMIQGEWLRVEFNDARLGRRRGYVQSHLVRVGGPDFEPTDLSLPTPPPETALGESAAREASRLAADEEPVAPMKTRMPPGFKWGGIGLLGAGALTIVSGTTIAAPECNDAFPRADCGGARTGWVAAGVVQAAAGALLLGIGQSRREEVATTSLQFDGRSLRWRIRF